MHEYYAQLNGKVHYVIISCDAMENDAKEVSKYQLISRPKLDKLQLQCCGTANVRSDGHLFPRSKQCHR